MSVILVTGGAGFIGSHTCVELLQSGHEVVVVDNLSNSSQESLRRVEAITGKSVAFHHVEMLDEPALMGVFRQHSVDAVVHFAALKAVGESVGQPLRYHRNNLLSTLNLLQCMKAANVRRLVFSSSCTVYGSPARVPVTEDFPRSATNPYGRTKLIIEEILEDLCAGEPGWQVVLLRYFNPVGAHPSGTMGEDPRGIPNNLMPFIMKVAVGKLEKLSVYGQDYPTPDGTGVRDYIHVVDLAQGHVAALRSMDTVKGCVAVNLGTGRGHSVLEVVKAAEAAVGKKIPLLMAPRRPGDIAATYADPAFAARLLGWKATRSLEEMCADAWRWQQKNPNGYSAQ